MAISLQADSINPRGYILINGVAAMTIDLSGVTFQNASFSLTNSYSVVSTNTTIPKNSRIAVNTASAPLTCTLPANPSPGDWVQVVDAAGTWYNNNLILARNGSRIDSSTEDLICDFSNQSITLVYITSGIGWQPNA